MKVRLEMRACRMAARNETCQICSDTAHGFHFGVLSCRACSAFFRRTVALNMRYYCRFQNNCQIDKSIRCMCRCCRYEKCLRVGMKSESVQLHRDSIKTSQKNFQNPPEPVDSCPISDSEKSKNVNESELFKKINSILDEAATNPKTSSELSILEMFRIGMNHIRNRRTVIHTEKFIDVEPFFGKEEFMDLIKKNWDMVTAMSGREIELYSELLSFIKPFVNLPPDQRWLLFKQFAMSFMKFERTYETYRIYGRKTENFEVSFNGQNMNFISALLRETDPSKGKKQRQAIISLFGPSRSLVQRGLLNPMIDLKLSEIEFAALSLHLLWLYPCSDGVTEETEKISIYWRRQAFNDLHNYYSNSLLMSNYAMRLGDFMALMSILEKSVSFKKENIVIADIFSLAKIHPSLFSLFR